MMSEEYASPDRVELVRRFGEAWRQRDSDAVLALLRFSGHARASGVEMTGGMFEVFRFQADQIARIEDFTDRAEALKAVGLEE